jgi:hypothetical protein
LAVRRSTPYLKRSFKMTSRCLQSRALDYASHSMPAFLNLNWNRCSLHASRPEPGRIYSRKMRNSR